MNSRPILEVVPWEPWHLEAIDLCSWDQELWDIPGVPEYFQRIGPLGATYTMMRDNVPVYIGGCVKQFKTGGFWSLSGASLSEIATRWALINRRYTPRMMREVDVKLAHMLTRSENGQAARHARVLGFKLEAAGVYGIGWDDYPLDIWTKRID